MPSWNIHTAHAERLLHEDGAAALGICDVDAFLLGNLLPDIYVGYMVPDVTRKIEYQQTHFADPNFVPEPDYGHFIEVYANPDEHGRVSDLVLGCWAHLVADHDYNQQVNTFIQAHGIKPCTETRVKKQADFDLFGKTLSISQAPNVTSDVLGQCATFTQYKLVDEDMLKAQAAMERVIEDNASQYIAGTPEYQMLGSDFFAATYEEVSRHIRRGLLAYAAGDPAWGVEP